MREIRIHTDTEHRICYVARFAEGIYVLHAFEKRTQKTAPGDIELARTRHQELLAWRREQGYGRLGKDHSIQRERLPRLGLLRGKVGLFSTDTLIDMLARLGVTVRVAFAPSHPRRVA